MISLSPYSKKLMAHSLYDDGFNQLCQILAGWAERSQKPYSDRTGIDASQIGDTKRFRAGGGGGSWSTFKHHLYACPVVAQTCSYMVIDRWVSPGGYGF